jgi:hypothetical protein
MPVPTPSFGALHLLRRPGKAALRTLLLLLTLLPAVTLPAAHTPPPTARIPLDPLGFQPLLARYLLGGSSMITLHYVDDRHVLFTFVTRRLIRRTPEDRPHEQHRNVDALLLELPSGRVLARTEWLLHDHGQYLWNLGGGQFLLRIRDEFSAFAPLANLGHHNVFLQRPFLHSTRHVVAVILSPDAGLLTIETSDPLPDDQAPPPSSGGPAVAPAPSKYQLNFYRLGATPTSGGAIIPRVAGGALSARPIVLPLASTGLLQVIDQGHQRWAFDFRSHTGKISELALFDSTCRPVPTFVGPSEFVAFGCHGGGTRGVLGGFNLRGDATWLSALSGTYIAPTFDYAPSAGRFALGRLLINSASVGVETLDPAMVNSQSVDVFQNDSGKQIFHIDCSPTARAGQNFALSPDGMSLAVIRDGAIEIYPLPPLGSNDKAAIQLAKQTAPPVTDVPVDLTPYKAAATKQAKAKPESSSVDVAEPAPQPAPPLAPQLPANASRSTASSASVSAKDEPGDKSNEEANDLPSANPADPAPPASESSPTPTNNPEAGDPQREPHKPPTLYNLDAPDPAKPPQ